MKITKLIKHNLSRSSLMDCDNCFHCRPGFWCVVDIDDPYELFWIMLCTQCVDIFTLTPLAILDREETLIAAFDHDGANKQNVYEHMQLNPEEFELIYEDNSSTEE